jgi:uncharacterized membrane protein
MDSHGLSATTSFVLSLLLPVTSAPQYTATRHSDPLDCAFLEHFAHVASNEASTKEEEEVEKRGGGGGEGDGGGGGGGGGGG